MKYVLALVAAVVLVGLSNAASFKTKALFNRFQALHKRDDNDSNQADEEKCEIFEDEEEKKNCWQEKEFEFYWSSLTHYCDNDKSGGFDGAFPPEDPMSAVCRMMSDMHEQLSKMTQAERDAATSIGIANMQMFADLYGLATIRFYKLSTKFVERPTPSESAFRTVDKLMSAFSSSTATDEKRNVNLENVLKELKRYISQ